MDWTLKQIYLKWTVINARNTQYRQGNVGRFRATVPTGKDTASSTKFQRRFRNDDQVDALPLDPARACPTGLVETQDILPVTPHDQAATCAILLLGPKPPT